MSALDDSGRPGVASALASQQTPEMASAASSSAPVLRILSRNPTEVDVAAVTAVLHAALGELADAEDVGVGDSRSAWARSQRAVRSTLQPGAGAWRSFSG